MSRLPLTRRLSDGWRRDLDSPGFLELAALVVAIAVLAGVVLAGMSRATGGSPPAQVSLGFVGMTAVAGQARLEVTVINRTEQAFDGRVVATAGVATGEAAIAVPAGGTGAVDLRLEAACGASVEIRADGTGAPPGGLSVRVSCDEGMVR